MSELKLKQYMFSFEEGGWNTVWAKTLKGARKEAEFKYKGAAGLTPKLSSMHLATEEGLQVAMSLFW